MATVVEMEKKSSTPGSPPPAAPMGGRLSPYKPGEGTVTRLGLFCIAVAFALFASHHWYYGWRLARDTAVKFFDWLHLGFLVHWTQNPDIEVGLTWGGVAAILVGVLLGTYYFVYCKPKSAEFFVQVDTELRKVTWPDITPWFKPAAKVWGATYVVLALVVVLTIFIYGVDTIFGWLAEMMFYRS